jgi:hypothetical protein
MLFLANSAGATSGSVSSGSATGNTVKLQVSGASSAATITYLKGLVSWQQSNLLVGYNGVAALTFADVAIGTLTPYQSWATNPAQGLAAGVNDGPADDPDLDGIENQLEFVLGGAPTVSSQAPLPTLTKATGSWTFTYNRSVASRPPGTTQIVEYGDTLTGWTQLTIPAGSTTNVAITPQGDTDRVEVTLPALGATGFARLKVTQ